jgi:hypothetical protein
MRQNTPDGITATKKNMLGKTETGEPALSVSSLIPRKLYNYTVLAGLLTCFSFEASFPFLSEQWLGLAQRLFAKLTAAGLFRIHT